MEKFVHANIKQPSIRMEINFYSICKYLRLHALAFYPITTICKKGVKKREYGPGKDFLGTCIVQKSDTVMFHVIIEETVP